ncbi:hypothetical protein [Shewanella inventionis]|uniref:Uncharacterized protein n=1 Tax=Shewanella inventionis TaxID=1738770 RepID=A0ABQ1JRZ0_9GAMM|nr:hypothetical protein [Shewanella inventionis]MCL1159513.1 hypothetical protein [Shewanella inventionis]GGB73491.1 hypothetical protein GCM10011607_37420 [Shewanella inventionis]
MSEEIEQQETKLKRITIKTETGSKWFDEPEKLLAWVQQQRQLYAFHSQVSQRYQMHQLFSTFDQTWSNLQQQITNGLKRFKHAPEIYKQQAEQFSQDKANQVSHKLCCKFADRNRTRLQLFVAGELTTQQAACLAQETL